jgi:ribose transport system ATP-binding protein
LPPNRLIQWMVGREFEQQFPTRRERAAQERLRVENFSVRANPEASTPAVDQVSFSIGAGEIVGMAGLQGSGNSELFWGLFGAYGPRRVSGRALLNGEPLTIRSPRCAIEQRVAMLTNDRKATGLVLPLSIIANTTLAHLPHLCRAGFRQSARETAATSALAEKLALAAASLDQEVGSLSGGNQQKVALAKWLQTKPELLLLDEPTRGIDVGAKREIYEILTSLAAEGISILLITSELPELLALSDRILVMHRGRLTAEFTRAAATAENIIHAAMGRES